MSNYTQTVLKMIVPIYQKEGTYPADNDAFLEKIVGFRNYTIGVSHTHPNYTIVDPNNSLKTGFSSVKPPTASVSAGHSNEDVQACKNNQLSNVILSFDANANASKVIMDKLEILTKYKGYINVASKSAMDSFTKLNLFFDKLDKYLFEDIIQQHRDEN